MVLYSQSAQSQKFLKINYLFPVFKGIIQQNLRRITRVIIL
jgi:hypothetical protein